MGFLVSMVSWFHGFLGFTGFVVTYTNQHKFVLHNTKYSGTSLAKCPGPGCVKPALKCSLKQITYESVMGTLTGLASGADPGFFLGGGALVSCSTSTPINHIVFFFLQNTSCIRKPQVISVGGVRTPCTLPLDPPLLHGLHLVLS